MQKEYCSPEMEIVRFSLRDVILNSPVEENYGDEIGGGGGNSGNLDDPFGGL